MQHKTIFESKEKFAVQLPICKELREYHTDGDYPLVVDPNADKKAIIIGMFVVRPVKSIPFTETLLNKEGYPDSLYNEEFDWSYNLSIENFTGGGLVANGSALDAYRLGMQYGTSDAVIMSSNNVSAEGVDNKDRKGYIFQPYGPLQWPHVVAVDAQMEEKVQKQRELWQKMGYLSSRRYPAQVVFSFSGLKQGGDQDTTTHDFLAGRIFHDVHPTGEPIETYIVTSELGAERIRNRCHQFHLQERIEDMLIVLPPPLTTGLNNKDSTPLRPSSDLDLTLLPSLLYTKYNMKIINHDGGQKVLNAFLQAGIVSQLHLTLGRQTNLHTILHTLAQTNLTLQQTLTNLTQGGEEKLEDKFQYFFGEKCRRSVPRHLPIISLIEDCSHDEVAIAIFDTSKGFDLDK